jgi:hypothetical protein
MTEPDQPTPDENVTQWEVVLTADGTVQPGPGQTWDDVPNNTPDEE